MKREANNHPETYTSAEEMQKSRNPNQINCKILSFCETINIKFFYLHILIYSRSKIKIWF